MDSSSLQSLVLVVSLCLLSFFMLLADETRMEQVFGYVRVSSLPVDVPTGERQDSDDGKDVAKFPEFPVDHKPAPSPAPSSASTDGDDDNSNDEVSKDGEDETSLIKKLFNFYDGNPDRSIPDYSKYSLGDVPDGEFPASAWQGDAVYVNHFLDAAINLVDRTIAGIVEEYGGDSTVWEIPKYKGEQLSQGKTMKKAERSKQPSFYDEESYEGMSRRVLHAMMTNGEFNVVLAGHSAAAGHGNNFNQSSFVQFDRVMGPLMDNLGVKLKTKNMAMGTHPTVQSSLSGGAVYGSYNDVIIWDTAMTEGLTNMYPGAKEYWQNKDIGKDGFIEWLFISQMTSGEKIPLLISYPNDGTVLQNLKEKGMADVGLLNPPFHKLPRTTSEKQARMMSNSLRCLNPDEMMQSYCKEIKCEGICWKERDDFTPTVQQRDIPRGCVSWHPGWRQHRFTGRFLSMYILLPLRHALSVWQEETNDGNFPLPGEFWHLTERRDEMRSAAMDEREKLSTRCEELLHQMFDYDVDNPMGPKGATSHRVCHMKLTGATEYTPQNADLEERTLRSRLVGVTAPEDAKEVYDGYDDAVLLKDLVEEGGIDVEAIAAGWNGVPKHLPNNIDHARGRRKRRRRRRGLRELKSLEDIGWSWFRDRVGECDGTQNTHCGRQDYECILDGRHDGIGGMQAYGTTEFIEFRLGNVKGGWISAQFLIGEDDVDIVVEIWDVEAGEVVHTGELNIDGNPMQKPILPYQRGKVSMRNLWNDPDAEEGDYNVRLKVTWKSRPKQDEEPAVMLTHLYWSV